MTTYSRKFIYSFIHKNHAIFDHPIKGVQYKLPIVKLETTENAWSINKNKNIEEQQLLQKKIISLFNKLTNKNYESISIKFIELMKANVIDLKKLTPILYETILKLLCYNNSYIQLFNLYNNQNFNSELIRVCLTELDYTLNKQEDLREYKSLLEEPETIKKRYQHNNILFICDLYKHNIIEIDQIINDLIKLNNINMLCIIITNIHKVLKQRNKQLYSQLLQSIKLYSKDKINSAKLRFQCMDVLDKII